MMVVKGFDFDSYKNDNVQNYLVFEKQALIVCMFVVVCLSVCLYAFSKLKKESNQIWNL